MTEYNYYYWNGTFHCLIIISYKMFRQKTCGNTFSCSSKYLNKPCHYRIAHSYNCSDIPPTNIMNSDVCENVSKKGTQSNEENMGNKSITSDRILATYKGIAMVTHLSTLTCWIAKRRACNVSIGIGISSDQIEDKTNPWAVFGTDISQFRATSTRMTDK
jgi:hypothetical protein